MPDENEFKTRLLLALVTRELKTAFFLTLSDEPNIKIVATASNTAELLTFNRSLQPNALVVEWELPGSSMTEVYPELKEAASPPSIFIIGKPSCEHDILEMALEGEFFVDPEDLIQTLRAHKE